MNVLNQLSVSQKRLATVILPFAGIVLLAAGGVSPVTMVAAFILAGLGALVAYSAAGENQLDAERKIESLKVCQANVMLADENMNIVFVNDTVKAMLKSREQAIKMVLPNFDADNLVGTNVDVFHKNPAHQRQMIENLSSPYTTDLKVGGLTFGLVATPLFSSSGKRTGTVVEWTDKTEQLARERKEKLAAAENKRIADALTVCDTSVMIADENLNIIYMNKAVVEMLRARLDAIRTELPDFDVDHLMGASVDAFHKNPSHQRNLIAVLKEPYNNNIKLAGLTFNLIATPLFDDDNNRIGTVVEWKDITDELARSEKEARLAAENTRVKIALDHVSTNTMIADETNKIVYMNGAIQEMMANAERDIQKDLPNFNKDKLLGANMDVFHKNPAHQKNLIAALDSTYSTQISVGGRTFSLIANPVINDAGERIGTVVEWADRTEVVKAEQEVNAIVQAAASGDFSQKISLEGKEGFFLNLAKGLNTMMEVTSEGMNDVARMLSALANGDLTESIDKEYQGLFKRLIDDSNATTNKLKEVISKIIESAGAVANGADEIAAGNADLSQRTEEQASSLEETASSMEEMTSAVRQSSENAQHANQLAADTRIKAQEGGSVVSRAVDSMSEINAASKRIADIIGVIDEIAFQTNLLALNAAVEAARAGEQGRGFAVVAGEVRSLAQRSAAAAKEIKELIRDSVEKVDGGTELVNRSGQTLKEIVDAVSKVSTMITEITNAALEQTSGIEQVNQAVSQMDEMTQQNAALVEEASAAGEAMSEQAKQLIDMMAFFKLDANGNTFQVASQSSVPPKSADARHEYQPASRPSNSQDSDDEWEEF